MSFNGGFDQGGAGGASYSFQSASYESSSSSGGAGGYGAGAAGGFGGDALALGGGLGGGSVEFSQSSSSYGQGVGGGLGLAVSQGFGGQQGGNFAVSQSSFSAGGASAAYVSEIEQAILRSQQPIDVSETEEITVIGQRGVWSNKQEVVNWRGVIPITEYLINEDQNPEIITKRSQQRLEYIQELAIRYLRPPTPPVPGEIVITQENNTLTPPAPPLIIRQQPARPNTPEPLVIREAPPQAPVQVGRKVITISGKRLPPPPRKVVIERLAALPAKPQSVIIERWLPYSQVKRRVIFNKSNQQDAVAIKPRNVIVQWEAPQVTIRKEIKFLGIIRANPVEYVQRYGATLKIARDLPDYVLEIKAQAGSVFAADYVYNLVHELEGDLQAFKFVDLDREGLVEYRTQLTRLGISYSASFSQSSASFSSGGQQQFSQQSSSFQSGGGQGGFGGQISGGGFGGSASFGGAQLGGGFGGASGSSYVSEEIQSVQY